MSMPTDRQVELRYEELRREVLEGVAGPARGLALFLRRGMLSWMEAQASCASSLPAMEQKLAPVLPSETKLEIVRILAGMALGHCSEMPA